MTFRSDHPSPPPAPHQEAAGQAAPSGQSPSDSLKDGAAKANGLMLTLQESAILEEHRNDLRAAAQNGSTKLRDEWKVIPSFYQKHLVAERDRLKPIAEEADQGTGA